MIPGMTTAAPDQLIPQQQDTGMTGFNGLDGGVDVRTSFSYSRSTPADPCSPTGIIQHAVQQRSQQSRHT